MSDKESKAPPYKRYPKTVAASFLTLIFGVVYAVGFFYGYFPNLMKVLVNPVVGLGVGIILLLILAIGGFLYIRKSDRFGTNEIADQLTKREADKVSTRWHRNRGLLAMRTPLDGVDYVKSGGSDEDDHARIYEKVIQPKTDSNRKCILINLEQSVSVNVESGQSIDQAIMSMNDAVFFSEDAVKDFHEARENYKEKLAGSSPGETVIEEKPDGSVIRRNVSERTIQSADENQETENIESQA
jgi:hypothetical protein